MGEETEVYLHVRRDADGHCQVTLEEPDDCTSLHVSSAVAAQDLDGCLAAAGMGRLQASHALLDPEGLRQLAQTAAGGAVAADWADRFEAMLRYAVAKGWLAPDGSVQAHVEPSAEALPS